MILPRVKSYTKDKGEFILPFCMKVVVEDIYRDRLALLSEYFFHGSSLEFIENDGDLKIKFNPDRREDYSIKITKTGIELECGEYVGIRNAMATLSMLANPQKDGYAFDICEIQDAPKASHRGFMLDLARGTKPFDELVEDIVCLARLKINYLHIHLFDSKGSCVKLDCIPQVCCVENYYSKEDMRMLWRISNALGMEIIPEWDMPAHSNKLFDGIEGIECDIPEGTERFLWAACAGTEKTYALYEAIINEVCELFPGRFLHIGGDELQFIKEDERYIGYICHWMECSKCRKVMEKNGLLDIQDLYYYVILRIYEIVKKTGRTMIMWSDWIDCNRNRVLPTDIIMQFWRVAGEGRGPIENCSMNNQLKMGYTVINSHFEEVYIDLEEYMNAEKIVDWRWDERPYAEDDLKKNIIGSECCAWEFGNKTEYPHYSRTFAAAAAVFSDKMWNGDKLVFDNEYEIALTRAIFGMSTPVGLNICKCFGGIIPPRVVDIKEESFMESNENRLAYFDDIKCSKAEIENELLKLKGIEKIDKYAVFRTKEYIKYLQDILSEF